VIRFKLLACSLLLAALALVPSAFGQAQGYQGELTPTLTIAVARIA